MYGVGSQVNRSWETRIGWSGPAVTTSSMLVRNDKIWWRPSPVQSSSTATKGASSTSMRPRSAGVCSHQLPSSSRRSTLAKRQTSSLRLIGVPRYSQVPSRLIRNGRSPHSVGTRTGLALPTRRERAVIGWSAEVSVAFVVVKSMGAPVWFTYPTPVEAELPIKDAI